MESIVNNFIRAIGWSLFHSLWQGAIIYTVLFLVFILWPKISSRIKYNLALASLFLMFGTFCLTFVSLFEWPVANFSKQQIVISQLSYQELYLLSNNFSFKTEAYFPVVVTVYIIGIVFQLIMLLTGYFKLKQLKHANTFNIPEHWKVIFEMTLFQLKINKKVRFFLSEKVNVPLVVGFFKPVVLFPISLATQLDIKQVEAILIHELSHIRRNDYLMNLMKTFVETLLFFNPFVWLTTRFIHIEREHACDDLVINCTGTPLTYAHALLKLELLKNKNTPALSLAATGSNQHLYQRIKRITNMKTNYINVKQQIFILTLTIATVASLAWINPSKNPSLTAKKMASETNKLSALSPKSFKNNLIVRADTDTVKVKTRKSKITITDDNGNVKTYHSLNELPDSLRKRVARNIFVGDSISKFYNSNEWKAKMGEIQKNALALSTKYKSKQWEEQMAQVKENALAMAKKMESKEWKEQMAKAQENAFAMAKKMDSKEWKDQMAKVQENAFAIAKKMDSKEWKDQMAKAQEHAFAMAKKFDSKEWKDQMEKVQKNAEEIQKKYNSPAWKKKMEDLKKLQESPEYKELRKKYENDLNELKKKNGIDDDKVSFLFDSSMDIHKAFLPLAQISNNLTTNLNLENNFKVLEGIKEPILLNLSLTEPSLKRAKAN